MNVQETLAQIEHILTEVDLVLYEWTEAVDMMSFISSNAQIEMWTNEIPPRVVTIRNIDLLKLQGVRDVRIMHFTPHGWTKIGTTRLDEGPLAHFEVGQKGELKPKFPIHPPFEGFNKPTGTEVRNRILRYFSEDRVDPWIDNHPFFKYEEK